MNNYKVKILTKNDQSVVNFKSNRKFYNESFLKEAVSSMYYKKYGLKINEVKILKEFVEDNNSLSFEKMIVDSNKMLQHIKKLIEICQEYGSIESIQPIYDKLVEITSSKEEFKPIVPKYDDDDDDDDELGFEREDYF